MLQSKTKWVCLLCPTSVVHVLIRKVYLIGGSIPEVSDGSFYNTATVWCPQGQLLATHRKIHLFDIGL